MTYDFTIGLSVTLSVLAVGVAVYVGFRINGFLRRSGQLCCHIHVSEVWPSLMWSGTIVWHEYLTPRLHVCTCKTPLLVFLPLDICLDGG